MGYELEFYPNSNGKYTVRIKDNEEATRKLLAACKTKSVRADKLYFFIKGIAGKIESGVLDGENKPVLRKGENPIVTLSEFVKKNSKENIKCEMINLTGSTYRATIKARITLPNGVFKEAQGRSKRGAKRNAARYIIEHWGEPMDLEWVPKNNEGFWSVNWVFTPQANTVGYGCYQTLIDNDNCFISKAICCNIVEKIKDLFNKYQPKSYGWEPQKGDSYYYIGPEFNIYKKNINTIFDCDVIKNNCFKTKELAEKIKKDIFNLFKEGRKESNKKWLEGGYCVEIDLYQRLSKERALAREIYKSMVE